MHSKFLPKFSDFWYWFAENRPFLPLQSLLFQNNLLLGKSKDSDRFQIIYTGNLHEYSFNLFIYAESQIYLFWCILSKASIQVNQMLRWLYSKFFPLQ